MTVIDNAMKRMMSGIRLSLWLIAMLVALQPLQASTISHLEQIKIGSLVVEQDGQGELLPLMDTQVKIHINGLIARTELKQYFENPSADVIEATYYFPLPEDAAVDGLVMTIGDRRIVGQIKEKAEAKKVYQAAVKAGKKAAILEQGQANLFRSKVANIGPGEVIEVSLTLYQSVQYQHGQFSLRFPTTITPKYQPQPTQQLTEQFTSGAWQANATERDMTILTVPEAARTDHQLAIDVTLNAGIPLESVFSESHAIKTQQKNNRYSITLDDYYVSDRDFVLTWQVKPDSQPRLVRFDESIAQDPGFIYTQLVVIPPAAENSQPLARDVTFIVDHSGSMEGQSMDQAKQALIKAIDGLADQDRFNIIGFNHEANSLFNQTLAVTGSTQHMARNYVRKMAADGGTEMQPALNLALNEGYDPNYVRQIVFLTDGAVGSEADLFRLIHDHRDQARLFTVGIGSAPNTYFMRKAAEFGQGSYTYISDLTQVAKKMTELTQQLQSPIMRSVEVGFSEPVEHYPLTIPDLYLGQPLHLIIRRPANDMSMTLDGQLDTIDWRANMILNKSGDPDVQGIARLWARQKIQQLLDEQIMSGQPNSQRDAILKLALEHQLMTPYTSFVAVEQRISRAPDQAMLKKNIPNVSPKGNTAFNYPTTGLNWRFNAFWAFVLLLISGVFISRKLEPSS